MIVVYDTTGDITGFDVDTAGQRTLAVMETFDRLSKNPRAKTPQGNNNYYADVLYRQSEFIYWMDHTSGGNNWGTDVDGASGSIILNGTDGSSTDAGDNIVLDATDSGGTDENGEVVLESGTSGYSVVNTPTKTEFGGGTDDYAVTAGELKLAYDKFEDTESLDVNLVSVSYTHLTLPTNC